MDQNMQLERKYCGPGAPVALTDGAVIEGYASVFGSRDQGGDTVLAGTYARSLKAQAEAGRRIKMLWQHDPTEPIGVWEEVPEDARGLYVKGRLLLDVARGREAAALIEAGAIDGLSIGYRTVRAEKNDTGQRLLSELELWEVSLVTFPMLEQARVGTKGESPEVALMRDLAAAFDDARQTLAMT
ncbi:MAG: HK97 family phage prohead protease [Pseudomonadota bacterium]